MAPGSCSSKPMTAGAGAAAGLWTLTSPWTR